MASLPLAKTFIVFTLLTYFNNFLKKLLLVASRNNKALRILYALSVCFSNLQIITLNCKICNRSFLRKITGWKPNLIQLVATPQDKKRMIISTSWKDNLGYCFILICPFRTSKKIFISTQSVALDWNKLLFQSDFTWLLN